MSARVDFVTDTAPTDPVTVVWLRGTRSDRATARSVLSARAIDFVETDDVDRVLSALAAVPRVVCIVDLGQGSGGGRALRDIQQHFPRALTVGLVDRRRRDGAVEAFRRGVFDVLSVPVTPSDLVAVVRNADEFLTLAGDASEGPAADVTGLVLTSPAMRRVVEIVSSVGAARCHVLISGEFGTGRETVARLLHSSSPRARGPFIKIDCTGTMPPELETMLFGPGDRDGHLAAAASGTLFLEHLEDMPPKVQARLARCLREAADTELDRSPRVFAAVQPNLGDLVREGRVRADLHQRLSLVRIDVPPLRDRREDVPLLARQLLSDLCRTRGYSRKTWTKSATTLVGALPWRGNLPELRGLIERLAIMLPGGVIQLEDLLVHVSLGGSEPQGPQRLTTLREAREQFERDYIAATLRRHRGRMAEAARALGIQRTNLYRKVRTLNLSRTGT